MNRDILGPILISSDSEDDLQMTIISDSPPPKKRYTCDVLTGRLRPRLTIRPKFKKRHKSHLISPIISGPIIVISDDESETPTRDECVTSPSESTKENKSVEELYEIDVDDINDKKKYKAANMESSSILSERHLLSTKNFYPRINGSPTNRYSPIKRSETFNCLKPNSINIKSRNTRCMKPQQSLNHVQVKQVLHQLIKPIDNLPRTDVLVRRGHIPHNQLISSGLPNHLVKHTYRDERSHVNDGKKQDMQRFSNIHNNIIDAYIEEEIEVEGVMFIQDFTTTLRNPEEHCLQYLLNTLLVTDERGLTCTTYRTLKHIQNHHRLSRKDFPEDWDQIIDILKPLGDNCNISNMNRLLYLDLLTTVLEEDLHQHKLENTVRRSFISITLCPDHNISNLSKVINLLLKVVQRTSDSDSVDSLSDESIQQRVVFLLQKMFALSIDVCGSRVEGAMKIAEDLLYPFRNLLDVEHRRQILETMQSDVLRLKLIELWLENCCELKDTDGSIPSSAEPLSVDKIVNRHFRCKPSEDVDDVNVACEELSMVFYLLLKSYLAHTAGKVSPSPKGSPACYCSLQLSIKDKTWLVGIGDTVTQLRFHLNSFAAELTPKTLMYLNYIEVFRDLVDV